MIVGFSTHGQGGGRGPVAYLTGTQRPDGGVRTPPPVVVRGDPTLVRRLIDTLDFQHRYTSGVLSFAPGERITPAMEQRIMDGFEAVAFAGLAPQQSTVLWVRHTHAGHHELNFLIPRVELTTGKSLNIAPPGRATREVFDTFRSLINAEYGLADPDDPARARAVSLPNHLARLRADGHRKGKALEADIREAITAYVWREVDAGRIHDRAGVVAYLTGQGYRIPRQGRDYLTVELDPSLGAARGRVRLRGGLYQEDFSSTAARSQGLRYGVPDPERAATLAVTLERLCTARAQYHQTRYGLAEAPPPLAREGLAPYLARTVGVEAIPPAAAGDTRAPSSRRRQRQHRMARAVDALEAMTPEASPWGTPGGRPPGLRVSHPQVRSARLDDLVPEARPPLPGGLRGPGAPFSAHVDTWARWWAAFYRVDDLEQGR